MAGGKETPRQKMIGMMYLVLTALLALNVSKQVLDAFVAIEENMQKAAIKHMDRGDDVIKTLKSEIKATDQSDKEKLGRLDYFIKLIGKIDVETGKMISEIDQIKIELLKESKEDITPASKPEDPVKIVWKEYSLKNPLVPARLNLGQVQAKDQYDVPMAVMIGEEPSIPNPKLKGVKLMNSYNEYRLKLCSLLGSYKDRGKTWTFKPKNINKFKDNTELSSLVDEMIAKSNCNKVDDADALKIVYMELTKPETVLVKEEGSDKATEWPWIGKTFDHSPLVAAIASLTSMQAEILSARATALAHIKSKISTGDFSFNSIEGLATGPAFAIAGEDIELKVMMAAFDSDNQPVITGGGPVTVANGQGTIKMKASGGGEMKISGTVAIKKKSGTMAMKPWTHTVKIVEKQGTISLPELAVLYRNHNNIVECSAAGFPEADLVCGNGLTKAPNGKSKGRKQYVVKVSGAGKTSTLQVYGVNPVTKKRVPLLTETYMIKPLPKAQFVWRKGMTKLLVEYGEGITLKGNFTVDRWNLTISGVTKSFSGLGPNLSPEAISFLSKPRPGGIATFTGTYSGAGFGGRQTDGTAKL